MQAERKLKNLGIKLKRAEKSTPAVPRKVKLVSPSVLENLSSGDIAATFSTRSSVAGNVSFHGVLQLENSIN